jgi:uncharacterized protein
MLGHLTNTEVETLMQSETVGRIGCCADNKMYVVPISYAYGEGCVYCYTYEGKKVDMMRKNPAVCFQVDNMRDLSNWKSALCWGEFEELEAEDQRLHALEMLNQRRVPMISSQTMHISSQWPFSGVNTANLPGIFFRIKLNEKTGRYEKSDSENYFAT